MPKLPRGHIHPTTQLLTRAISAMEKIGFEVLTGPELTTERLNFDVLRIQKITPRAIHKIRSGQKMVKYSEHTHRQCKSPPWRKKSHQSVS